MAERKRFKWTRKKYYAAHHQNRLLQRLDYSFSPPPLVERYIVLMAGVAGHDPLTTPIEWRYDRCDIPF